MPALFLRLSKPVGALFCVAALGLAVCACDAPGEPPEPTIDVDKKVKELKAEVAKTRAEATKRVDTAASKVSELSPDAGANSDASGD